MLVCYNCRSKKFRVINGYKTDIKSFRCEKCGHVSYSIIIAMRLDLGYLKECSIEKAHLDAGWLKVDRYLKSSYVFSSYEHIEKVEEMK